jgi:geranylgeranyl transferase type-2 subunit beta
MPFLAEMSLRLAVGIETLDPNLRAAHTRFVTEAIRPDGGFAGRQGASDLYYTSFGLRCLVLLAVDESSWAERASRFLQSRLTPEPVGIDALSWILSAGLLEAVTGASPFEAAGFDRTATIRRWCEALRRPDGAYGKTPTAAVASTYQTFLATACLELLEEDEPKKDADLDAADIAVILARQQAGGGFVEIPQVRAGGTNPTAAALSFLKMQDALSDEVREKGVQFLASMQTGRGGFFANTQIPMPDLLSTFTALLTLDQLGALDRIDRDAAARFVRSLQRTEGGFLAGQGDMAPDVEYTFYGLGALSILGVG